MITSQNWFQNVLPSKIAKMAIRNTLKSRRNDSFQNFEQALRNSFNWSATPQGYNYWEEINILYSHVGIFQHG